MVCAIATAPLKNRMTKQSHVTVHFLLIKTPPNELCRFALIVELICGSLHRPETDSIRNSFAVRRRFVSRAFEWLPVALLPRIKRWMKATGWKMTSGIPRGNFIKVAMCVRERRILALTNADLD
jgi:hypothetical protein